MVFVPLWIVLCLSLVAVLYSIIFCGILLRTPEVSHQQKKSAINSAIGNCATVLPILVFQVLLADKLDNENLDWPFIGVAGPLLLSLFVLILLSFNAKGGNKCKFKFQCLTIDHSNSNLASFPNRVVRHSQELLPVPAERAALPAGVR